LPLYLLTPKNQWRNKKIRGVLWDVIGNPVEIGSGPAAVIGDESRIETFEKWSALAKFKAGENLNRRNTCSIVRIKILAQHRNWAKEAVFQGSRINATVHRR
jgi:hypothetical protein